MVRHEAVILGAQFLPSTLIAASKIRAGSLTIYGVECVAIVALAAAIPARRGARIDVLDAIAASS